MSLKNQWQVKMTRFDAESEKLVAEANNKVWSYNSENIVVACANDEM